MADQPLINPKDQNQLYMNPSLQNNSTSDQSYNSSVLIDKPKNPISKPTPQNLSAPMSQPAYPQSQGVTLSVQQGLSVNNYPPQIQTPNNEPLYVQPVAPVYKTQYQNYRNISEVPHKGLYQIDENTFFIPNGIYSIIFPFIFFISEVLIGLFYLFFLIFLFGY